MRIPSSVLAAAIFEVAFIGVIGCGSGKKEQGKSKKPPSVQAVAAVTARMVERLETTGDVVAANSVTIHSTVEGPIRFCPWREGDPIEQAGQKLIEISRPFYRQEVSSAESGLAVALAKLADLKAGARPEEIAQAKESVRHFEDCTSFAKTDLERTASLVKSGALPPEDEEKARVSFVKCQTQLEAAKERVAMLEAGPTVTEIAVAQAAVDEAASKRDLAQAKLDECLIQSPFAGVITEVLVRPGDLARPQTPLIKMMDPSSLVVRTGLPENCIASIHKGTEAVIRLDAYPGKTFGAEIERIYPRLEWDSRTRIVEVKVMDPVNLIPHLFARVSVQGRVVDNAVVVPDSALVATPRGGQVVYVVNDGKAHLRKVQIGLEEKEHVQITEGISENELVIVAGNLNLKDGTQVQVNKLDFSIPASNVQDTNASNVGKDIKAEMEHVLFQNKFPIYLRKFDKSELRVSTLDELCQYFTAEIQKHPFARYIDTFDHYSHTQAMNDSVMASNIVDAKNILFCFGKKLESPEVLSVRPRSIGLCETESQFIISFLEAPSAKATETMERWVCELIKTVSNGENGQASGENKGIQGQ